MANFLLEILCEELPANYLDAATIFLKEQFSQKLLEAKFNFNRVDCFATPKRLTLICYDVDLKQVDEIVEITGPKASIAFDDKGNLTPAGLGFLKSRNILAKDCFKKVTEKGEVLAAKFTKSGILLAEFLPSILDEILKNIPFTKKMWWNDSKILFARPIRSIIALIDDQILPFSFAGLNSSNETIGHRFLAPGILVIESVNDYFDKLKKAFVILDKEERKAQILFQAQKLAQDLKAQMIKDEDLLNEVANLVEYPFVLLGEFEAQFLSVPKEILISELKAHQKCFALVDDNQNMLPKFILVAATKPKDEKFVASGYAKVIRARFSDGEFYFKKDQEISLEQMNANLSKLLFQYDLGFMEQKVARIKQLAAFLCEELKLDNKLKDQVINAASFCKADLVSGVVSEFPELQGVMGEIYALNQSFDPKVAQAIKEHYWPKNATDNLPTSDIGALVSLADRFDTLVGIIGIKKLPRASQDPFALRRAAIGMGKIIIHFKYDISLEKIIDKSMALYDYSSFFVHNDNEKIHLKYQICDFIIQRVKGILLDSINNENIPATLLVDSVIASGADNIYDLSNKLNALSFVISKDYQSFAQVIYTVKRACNIVKKAQEEGLFNSESIIDYTLLQKPSEQKLYNFLQEVESNKLNYLDLLQKIVLMRPLVDKFFDEVMIMDSVVEIRQMRLGLLYKIMQLSKMIADFQMLGSI
jgi:glycyl-tRNA synthetase beta chain